MLIKCRYAWMNEGKDHLIAFELLYNALLRFHNAFLLPLNCFLQYFCNAFEMLLKRFWNAFVLSLYCFKIVFSLIFFFICFSTLKTLNLKNEDTFVKENYMKSRDRITFLFQIASDENIKLQKEFIFKGKGTRSKIKLPDNLKDEVKYQWSTSGSYQLEQILSSIENLPNRSHMGEKHYAIYVLDIYAVCILWRT